MDIKEKINDIVEAITKDGSLKEKFQEEPIKVIEEILGVDLPDEAVEKIIDGVKAKISVDQISGIAGKLKGFFKK